MAITELPPFASGLRPALTTELRAEGARTVIVLRGEADMSTTAVLSDTLSRVTAMDAGDVVIDLAALAFLDSGTVRLFARFADLLAHRDRALVFRSPSRLAGRVLDLVGLTAQIEEPEQARR